MARMKPCSEYIEGAKVCASGWPVVSGTCFGIIDPGCKCGADASLPPCMKDNGLPASFIQDSGLPIYWPKDSTHDH